MLTQPTIETMKSLKLFGMARALESQMELKEVRELPFEDRLAMLLEAEFLDKENSRTKSRLRRAKLRLSASMENLKPGRGLDRTLTASLSSAIGFVITKTFLSLVLPVPEKHILHALSVILPASRVLL